ncbi:hypothetical protein [Celerinatantimonas sp. YJH-8]|uniref:hypothetical protein n=1 Tax=Celerinatantimonas sp. YJH-8 TaxID=3228714 RepID=UPI0038C20801
MFFVKIKGIKVNRYFSYLLAPILLLSSLTTYSSGYYREDTQTFGLSSQDIKFCQYLSHTDAQVVKLFFIDGVPKDKIVKVLQDNGLPDKMLPMVKDSIEHVCQVKDAQKKAKLKKIYSRYLSQYSTDELNTKNLEYKLSLQCLSSSLTNQISKVFPIKAFYTASSDCGLNADLKEEFILSYLFNGNSFEAVTQSLEANRKKDLKNPNYSKLYHDNVEQAAFKNVMLLHANFITDDMQPLNPALLTDKKIKTSLIKSVIETKIPSYLTCFENIKMRYDYKSKKLSDKIDQYNDKARALLESPKIQLNDVVEFFYFSKFVENAAGSDLDYLSKHNVVVLLRFRDRLLNLFKASDSYQGEAKKLIGLMLKTSTY